MEIQTVKHTKKHTEKQAMRRLWSRLIGLVATATVLGSPMAGAAIEKINIGMVDMQRALQGVSDGQNARSALEKEFTSKKKQLEKEKVAIEKMHKELQKQSLVLNEKALAKKQAELQRRVMKLQELTGRSQFEIQKREQELTRPIVEKLRTIIAQLAKDQGYTVVLEKSEQTILYSLPKDDLTDQVIKRYNK